jgi:Uma2 family endonuclease
MIRMTARQFLRLGEDPPGVRLELIDGEIVVRPTPAPRHSFAVIALMSVVATHVEDKRLGELLVGVDITFGEHDVRRPDLLYFRKSRRHLIGEILIEGLPDLAVEVLSPGNERSDRRDKFKLYASGGVKHYWIVDPKQRTIEAYVLRKGKFVRGVRGSGSDVVRLPPFPRLEIPLSKLWRPK